MADIRLLGLPDIAEQRPGRPYRLRMVAETESPDRVHAELLLQKLFGLSLRVSPARKGFDEGRRDLFETLRKLLVFVQRGVKQDLRRGKPGAFVLKPAGPVVSVVFRNHKGAGGQIEYGASRFLNLLPRPSRADAHQVIVRARIEHRRIGYGSRRNDPDDFPFYDPLSQRRILHLLADRDLVALFDESRDI